MAITSSALPTSILMQKMQLTQEAVQTPNGQLTLDQAIQEALARSPELQQIKERINASTEQIKQAEASFYPRLVISEDFNATNNPVYALMDIINQRRLTSTVDFNNPGKQQNFSSVIRGEWSLFEGGSQFHNLRATAADKRSMESQLLGARNQLVAKVTETYYRWLQALGFINVAERSLKAAMTDQQLGESRFRAEMALSSEVLRLKARTAESESNLVTAQTSARRLQAAMERLIARPMAPNEIPRIDLSIKVQQQNVQTDTSVMVEHALGQRPEMAAIRSIVEAASNRVRASQGSLLPKLGTSAQYQWDSEDLTNSAASWMVGFNATWPLFEGGLTLSKISEAKSRLQEMQAKGEQLALDIALEVQQSNLAVQEAVEKIRVTEKRKMWAQQALEEVRYLYRNQVVTVDALLQAEVAWNQAEIAHASAIFECMIAQALLRQSLGDFADGLS